MTTTSKTSTDAIQHDSISDLRKLVHRATILGITCAVVVAGVFVVFSIRMERSSKARDMLIEEMRAKEQSRLLASKIIVEVERARIHETASEMWPMLDQIEILATRVMNGD